MNVKEPHIVTGMSRDSSVSRQNLNLVYDAHNIRITTKDANNSLLSVTNEKGTSTVAAPGVVGDLLGYTILNDYLVLFTHKDTTPYDHIFRLTMPKMGEAVEISEVATVFFGDAGFDMEYPIEALPLFETETIQKVYWVDGKNQPRLVNIAKTGISNPDFLNFSREIDLKHTLSVQKFSTGGEFPVGTIQYAFSYYTKFGQESQLADLSAMYYLSPQENGLDAAKIANCSFEIKVSSPDHNFDYIRIYAIIRTSANTVPLCRVVGNYPINKNATLGGNDDMVVLTDNGIKGYSIEAGSLYFIGGEELIAGTLTQKDNTLFLGNIKLNRPNVGEVMLDSTHSIRYYVKGLADGSISQSTFAANVGNIVSMSINYEPGSNHVPTSATKYYDYSPNNNRSSYYIRRFKHLETYRLGFIAQYKNGQWSEPIWVGDFENNYAPQVAPQGGVGRYSTGCFHLNMPANIISKLRAAGYKRIAPVVVYPQAHERRAVMQGILCPTLYSKKDRNDNSPYAQSSWFFRLYHNVAAGAGSRYYHMAPIGGCGTPEGEVQCIDTSAEEYFCMDGNIVTFHSPDIECAETSQPVGLEGLSLRIVGFASASKTNPTDLGDIARVTDHFLETENMGINPDLSQVVVMRRTGYNNYSIDQFCYPLYFDSIAANESDDEVVKKDEIWYGEGSVVAHPACGWIVYPWHRQGSLNNQKALTTKQRSNGFNTRTAMLKRNITANAWFANSTYFDTPLSLSNGIGIYTPKIFNFDQLAGVKVAAGANSFMYYGNIDKVLTSATGKYPIYYGWRITADDKTQLPNISTLSENAMSEDGRERQWWNYCYYNDAEDYYTGTDPVSMKYKSSPHIVLKFTGSSLIHMPMYTQDHENLAFSNTGYTGSGMWIAELIRDVDTTTRFGGKSEQAFVSNDWIRCGESVKLISNQACTIDYLQGDCYIQRYDCLKTYPFTNEDQNSVIETFSTTLETYVNLDFRYDHNRGSGKNIALSPLNFNLYNHPAYEQLNNFFTYHGLDYDRFSNGTFPNAITWSTEKHTGEDIDVWASIDVSSSLTELDGAKGGVTALAKFKNDLYAFQKGAFARLLFNNRVQIPTSDNNPIEITNGMKMQGVQYISEKIGCSNKWSLVESPIGIYFNDDDTHSTYRYNGQLADLTTTKGMRTFMNGRTNNLPWNPKDFDNCVAFYNKIGRDLYWIYDDACLVFSEQTDTYVSFMDYERSSMMAEINGNTFIWHGGGMHLMHGGSYNYFFGVHKPYWLTLVSNSFPTENKIFNNVAWRDIVFAGSTPKPFHTFDHIRVWTEHQDTLSVRFSNSLSENPSRQPVSYDAAISNLRKKFNMWHCQIPRDKIATNSRRARISNPWCYIKLSREDVQTERLELMDIEVDYFK